MSTLSTDQRIKIAMRANEALVLDYVAKHGKVGGPDAFLSNSWRNAVKRLELEGLLKYSTRDHAYIRTMMKRRTK